MGEIHEERETNGSNAEAAPYTEICLKDAAAAQTSQSSALRTSPVPAQPSGEQSPSALHSLTSPTPPNSSAPAAKRLNYRWSVPNPLL